MLNVGYVIFRVVGAICRDLGSLEDSGVGLALVRVVLINEPNFLGSQHGNRIGRRSVRGRELPPNALLGGYRSGVFGDIPLEHDICGYVRAEDEV